MKKFLVILVLLVISFTTVSALVRIKPDNTEIINTISRSKDYNPEISDPNLIFPGQVLTFLFADGKEESLTVMEGDNQWTIVRDKLALLKAEHGEIVNYPEEVVEDKDKETLPAEENSFLKSLDWIWQNLFWILLILLVVGLYGLAFTNEKFRDILNRDIFSFFKKAKSKFSENPAEEGRPFVNGGVTPENSQNHFVNLAQRNNPNANIQITNRRQGYLSTVGGVAVTVEFGDKTKQKLSFRNEPAFAAMVSVNGKPAREEYFFQACGNPVYSRRSMNAGKNLIFTTEPISFGDEVIEENAIQKVTEPETEIEKTTEQQKLVVEKKDGGSDEVMIVNDHAKVADEFLKTQRAHNVTMEYIKTADGSVTIRSIFNTKNDPLASKEEAGKKEEKTEGKDK